MALTQLRENCFLFNFFLHFLLTTCRFLFVAVLFFFWPIVMQSNSSWLVSYPILHSSCKMFIANLKPGISPYVLMQNHSYTARRSWCMVIFSLSFLNSEVSGGRISAVCTPVAAQCESPPGQESMKHKGNLHPSDCAF